MLFCRLLRFFHQSIIINRYQLIIGADTSLQLTPVRLLFQVRHNLVQSLPDCYVRVIIHATVQFPVIHIINCIVIPFAGFLNTDITVCKPEGKLRFRPVRCMAAGIYIRIFPLHERYIFHDMLLVCCRHEVFHFPLSIEGIKPVHIKGNIVKPATL